MKFHDYMHSKYGTIITCFSTAMNGIQKAKTLKDVSNPFNMSEDEYNQVSDYVRKHFHCSNNTWRRHNQYLPLEQAKQMEMKAVEHCIHD